MWQRQFNTAAWSGWTREQRRPGGSQCAIALDGMLYLAKAARLFAYGTASVALARYFAASGLPPIWVGAVLAAVLLSGAAQMLLTSRLSHRFGANAIGMAAAGGMLIGGILGATGRFDLIVLAAALGTLNGTSQEIGPFLPLEQVTLAAGERGAGRMALYNAVGTGALALGTFTGGVLPVRGALALYALSAAVIAAAYARVKLETPATQLVQRPRGFGISERLAALFAVDAFAGGLIVQGFLAYWLISRYHEPAHTVGAVLAACNVLSALSLFVAARLGRRFGLLNTMVFTHLPSNVLLVLIPFAPSFVAASALLLARYSLSQMDVPTRQAFVVAIVPEHERIHAASITSAVRPVAAASSPLLSTLTMQLAASGAAFFAAGAIKACYDIAVLFAFRRHETKR